MAATTCSVASTPSSTRASLSSSWLMTPSLSLSKVRKLRWISWSFSSLNLCNWTHLKIKIVISSWPTGGTTQRQTVRMAGNLGFAVLYSWKSYCGENTNQSRNKDDFRCGRSWWQLPVKMVFPVSQENIFHSCSKQSGKGKVGKLQQKKVSHTSTITLLAAPLIYPFVLHWGKTPSFKFLYCITHLHAYIFVHFCFSFEFHSTPVVKGSSWKSCTSTTSLAEFINTFKLDLSLFSLWQWHLCKWIL